MHNDRFLLLPGVRVKNLASLALKLVHQRLPADWQQHTGARPLLLETCVEETQRGSCYKAAGWENLGPTKGRPPGGGSPVPPKNVWVLALVGKPPAKRSPADPPRGCAPSQRTSWVVGRSWNCRTRPTLPSASSGARTCPTDACAAD